MLSVVIMVAAAVCLGVVLRKQGAPSYIITPVVLFVTGLGFILAFYRGEATIPIGQPTVIHLGQDPRDQTWGVVASSGQTDVIIAGNHWYFWQYEEGRPRVEIQAFRGKKSLWYFGVRQEERITLFLPRDGIAFSKPFP